MKLFFENKKLRGLGYSVLRKQNMGRFIAFYLLSHWRIPLSIPTFGFCRVKNESYMKRFGKR